MIDINKRYCTKSGHEVRIYATDGGGDYPVHGAVLEKNYWRILSWDENGNLKSDQGQPYDIVEFKPRIKRSLWVNIYPLGGCCDFLLDS